MSPHSLRLSKRFTAVVGVVSVTLLCFYIYMKRHSEAYAKSHASIRTKMDIDEVGHAIKMYYHETKELPARVVQSEIGKLDEAMLYKTLYGDSSARARYGIGAARPSWSNVNMVVDQWGNNIHYILVNKIGDAPLNGVLSFIVKIYSNGPNMSDEHGGGDDIYTIIELEK